MVHAPIELNYELRSYWSDLEHITVGAVEKFIFGKEGQRQLYHLELDGMQFQQVRIVVKPETRRLAFDKVRIYGKYGRDSEPTA